jgi:hypothetical protein
MMSKFETGLVITLLLALSGGIFFLGEFHGRIKAIENDKDYASFKKEKQKALREISDLRKSLVILIEKEKKEFLGLKSLEQKECRLVDSATKGGQLQCKVGEYVAGAKNLSDSNRILDMIICCTP